MKKILGLLAIICSLSQPVIAQNNGDSLGYRYRVTFEVSDEIGKKTVHAYTNTWVYSPYSGSNSLVWLANPHPDITPTGDFSTVMIPSSCLMLVGKGILVIERPGSSENEVRRHGVHGSLSIMQSVTVYDFVEESEIRFENSECRK